MRHDRRGRAGLTVVEIVLVIALVVLPVTLVLILFGKDIKRWMGGTFGSARTESQQLYRDRSAKGMAAVKTGSGGAASSEASGGGGGGTAAAPVQSTSKAPGGGSVQGQVEEPASEGESKPSAALAILAVAAALVAALAATRKR